MVAGCFIAPAIAAQVPFSEGKTSCTCTLHVCCTYSANLLDMSSMISMQQQEVKQPIISLLPIVMSLIMSPSCYYSVTIAV